MSLKDRLLDRIAAAGPIPFEEFMAASLYDPEHGFFATGPLRSVKSGDFLTSPEVSPWFGRILGRFVSAERERVGDGYFVADVGAGSGSLLESLVDEIGSDIDVFAVDASPQAREVLARHLDWIVGESIDDLPVERPGVIIANELLDNLPVSLVVRTGKGWEERWVGASDDGLALVPSNARREVAEWADAYGGVVPEGGLVEVQLAAGEWMRHALGRLGAGAVLVIDYGGTAEELEPRRTRGTLRTYRAHHLGPDPLLEPGATDVTVDVNFTALEAIAKEVGAEVEIHRQDDFLTDLGLRDEVARLRRAEYALARNGDEMQRLTLRSQRLDVETLLHPRGLGDFRVMVARPREPHRL